MSPLGSLMTILLIIATLLIPQILALYAKTQNCADSEEFDSDDSPLERGGLTRHARAICGFRAD